MDDEIVVVPLEDSIDLHTFAPREVPLVLGEYLGACRELGITEARVIHGKGRGVLRAGVLSFLEKCDLVQSFFPAPPERGGWGAVIVILKPNK
ncbi:MAG: Smr/MutS family protein [Pseudomonadota bacterium]